MVRAGDMPSTSARAISGSARQHDHTREGESSLQRRHPTSGDPTDIAVVDPSTSTEVAELERSSSDDAERQSNTENRVADPPQLAQDMAQMLDMESLLAWAEHRILPFFLLLLTHIFIQHFYSFIQGSLLLISTASSTLHLQAVVAAPQEHTLVKARDVLILVNLNIWALSLLGIPDQQMWQAIFMQVSKDDCTLWQCLYYSIVAPMLVKQWLVVPKTVLAAACAAALPGDSRSAGRTRLQTALLTAIEHISIAWTDAVPVTIWFPYLLSLAPAPSLYASSLAGLYLALKARTYLVHLSHLALALRNLACGSRRFGAKVSPQEALEGGLQCPICQESPNGPVKLSCGHVFCEKCVAEWLERERTCPMCRSTVRHDTLQSYGSGTTNLLPNVF
eukprot:jgi/Ulvmu1/3870/UM018_0089.1